MGEIVRMDNGKDNEIMAMMNDDTHTDSFFR